MRRALRSELAVDDDRARAAARLLQAPIWMRWPPWDRWTRDWRSRPHLRADPGCDPALPGEVEAVASELDRAGAGLAAIGERRAHADELRDRLLSEALAFHDAAGDSPCPVCDTGTLDADWAARAREAVEATDLLRAARGDAERRAGGGTRGSHPGHRWADPARPDRRRAARQPAAAEAWRRWAAIPAPPTADHLRAHQPLAAVGQWQHEARAHAETVAEQWSPYALRLANWSRNSSAPASSIGRPSDSTP